MADKESIAVGVLNQVWVTNTGVVFLLEEMPTGVNFFRADENADLKLRLLLQAASVGRPVSVIFPADGGSTRQANEIRLTVGSGKG